MTYRELIKKLAKTRDIPEKQANKMAEGVFTALSNELGKGVGVSIPKLGTFTTKTREARRMYSPHHKKMISVPPRRVVNFTPAASIKENLKIPVPDDE